MGFNYLALALLVVQGVVLVPLYLRLMDARIYGAWLATGNIVGYLGMLDFGLTSVTMQRVSHALGGRNRGALVDIIGTSLILTVGLSLLTLLASAPLALLVPHLVKVEGSAAHQLIIGFFVAALSTSLVLVNYGANAVLVGLQRQLVMGITGQVSTICGIAATVLFLHRGLGVVSIPLGLLCRSLLGAASSAVNLAVTLRQLFPGSRLRYSRSAARDLWTTSMQVFVVKLASTAVGQSDGLVVAAVADPRLTATYALTKKAADVIDLLAIRVSTSLTPALAHLAGEGHEAKTRRIIGLSIKVAGAAALLGMGGFVLFNRAFVQQWVGSELYGGARLTLLLGVAGALHIVGSALDGAVFSQGETALPSRTSLLEAALRIPLAIGLCARFGIEGVAAAAVLAALPSGIFWQGRWLLRRFGVSLRRVARRALQLLAVCAVPLAAGTLLSLAAPATTVARFIGLAAAYGLFACAAAALFDRDARSLVLRLLGHR
jgi:O-antigen/teichoic acid export membrane protein